MAATALTPEFKNDAEETVASFNMIELARLKNRYQFVLEFKGKFIYLMLREGNKVGPAGRLTYNGDPKKLSFAIFKWSSEKYDADEYFFPGVECLDGTVKGALKAILKAYPPDGGL
jgi:hypothetical protein